MPVSDSFLNSHKRKYLCDDEIENGQDKKFKFGTTTSNDETNMDLRYLFEIPVATNLSLDRNHIIIDNSNLLNNNNNSIIINPNNNNISNNNNNNNISNDVNMHYDNDHMMDDDEVSISINSNTNDASTAMQPQSVIAAAAAACEITTPIDMKQNFSFWKYHVHDSYFHCRSHYF